MAEDAFPTEACRRAWARAIRHPDLPIAGHDDARVVRLPGGVAIDSATDRQGANTDSTCVDARTGKARRFRR